MQADGLLRNLFIAYHNARYIKKSLKRIIDKNVTCWAKIYHFRKKIISYQIAMGESYVCLKKYARFNCFDIKQSTA